MLVTVGLVIMQLNVSYIKCTGVSCLMFAIISISMLTVRWALFLISGLVFSWDKQTGTNKHRVATHNV